MFTGIVEEKGSVRYMQLTGESGVLAVKRNNTYYYDDHHHPVI